MWECFLFLSCGDPWKEHFLALEQFWTCTAPCPDHWERTQRGQQTNLVITLRGWSRLMTASSMFLPPDWTTFEGRKEHQTPHPPRPGWVPCEPEPRTAVQGEGWTWGWHNGKPSNKTQNLKILHPLPSLTMSPEIAGGSGKISSKVVCFQFTDIKISYTKAKQKKNAKKKKKRRIILGY